MFPTPEMLGQKKSIKDILADEELKKFRTGFHEEVLLQSAQDGMGSQLPESLWFVDALADHFYKKAPGQSEDDYKRFARERESQLITLFMSRANGQGTFLSIHFYWGMMMGLSPADLGSQVLLVGFYGGVQVLNAGLVTLNATLTLLKELASTQAFSTLDVLRQLPVAISKLPPMR